MADFNLIKNEFSINGDLWGFFKNIFKRKEKYDKNNANILFIDDLDMPVVDSLKKSGYRVRKVKDVKDIDDPEVKAAQIIFVDFDGVGRVISPIHQGAGLIKEIKDKYRKSKYLVLYTAQKSLPSDTTMSALFDVADDRMRKDSDVTDFTNQIREGLKKIQ